MFHVCTKTWYWQLMLPIKGPMEDAGVVKLYKPSPTPCLYVAHAENMVGRIPLMPCFLDGNATPTIPHKYSKNKSSSFPAGCALSDSALTPGPDSDSESQRLISARMSRSHTASSSAPQLTNQASPLREVMGNRGML